MSVSLGLVKMAARVWTESTATPVGVPRAMRAPTVNRVSIGPRQSLLPFATFHFKGKPITSFYRL